ncbi:MAG: poly-beta-1,6 N-acetyl-D-glucosamine export porin PgaA [Gammaproteobacteria bacterium]|nr:poly-beta-1,6 N-acetyl-D-glucosamine export porin PgaA [Gammaproteobacteria bacterium]
MRHEAGGRRLRAVARMWLVACLWASLPGAARGEDLPADVQARAVAEARAGRYEWALSALAQLREHYPQERRYLHDYIEVLGWAGRETEAVALIDQVDLKSAPFPVLETLAKAARNQGRYPQAERVYRAILVRDPAHLQAGIGLAYAVAESGRREAALRQLAATERHHPQSLEIWFARGYVNEVTAAHADALYWYQRVLDRDPAHREATRRRVLTLAKMGAPHLAYDLMQRQPGLYAAEERFTVAADRAAIQTRWGGTTPISRDPYRRFDDTDRALRYLDDLHGKPWEQLDLASDRDRRLAYDRMAALRDRVRMKEVIEIYERLRAGAVEIPNYALMAAGDAYVYEQQPEVAIDIYRQVLQTDPKGYNARLALFYAYTEVDDFQHAYAIIDRLSEEEAVWRRHPEGKVVRSNPRKFESEVAATLGRAYADDLVEANDRFDGMYALAPASLDLKQELASVHRRRGWPRRALHEYGQILAEEPDFRLARIGHGAALFDRHRYPEAERILGQLESEFPEDKQVQRFARTWELYERRELVVETRYGHTWDTGDGTFSELGNDSIEVDSFLFSRPINYYTRAYLHQHFATADFEEGTGTDHRLSAGVEYTQPNYLVAAEVGGGFADSSAPTATVRGTWYRDDHFSVSGVAELSSTEVPLRGIRAGVDGNFAGVSAQYRWHESQAVRVGYGYLDFDDGNERNQVGAVFERRVIQVPHYRMTAFLEGAASANDRDDVIYYSPESDASLGLTLENEWVNYRRYERRFAQRLGLSLGGYWEENYSPDYTWWVSYQHDWDYSEAFRLHYGVVHGRRVFDGDPEYETAIVAGIDVRF